MRRLRPVSICVRPPHSLAVLGGGLLPALLAWLVARPPASAPPAPALGTYDPWLRFRCEINTADSAALERLPGIGPVLARRIVEQRERLGGFRTVEEVLTVTGLRRQWNACSRYLLIDPLKGEELHKARRQSLQAAGPLPDLNTADSLALVQRAGLPGWLTRRLIRYRQASGGFSDWNHVARTWDLKPAQLEALQAAFSLKPPPALDLNAADYAALDRLPGIGERRAKAILNYREALGFFARVEQLREVYNLPDSVYERIRARVRVGQPLPPPPLAVNLASAEELARHPYLRKVARRLVRYRHEAGLFRNLDDLLAAGLIDSTDRDRLRPYLRFDR